MNMKNKIFTWRVVSYMLTMLAVVFGGGVAMADPTVVSDAPIGDEGPIIKGSDDPADPANPSNNDLRTPGDGTAGETINGTQMSSSQQLREQNIEDEWDEGITQFQPWRTPLLSIARKVSRKVQIKNWTVKHARIGGDTLDGKTTANIAAGATCTISPSNFQGSLSAFYKGTTIFVPMVAGYKRDSASETENCLMLFVTDYNSSSKTATCVALNGPLADGASADSTDYDARTVPAIPSGSYMCAGASIAGESQLLITPENYQPRSEEFCVQKKLLNIVWTGDFEKVKKKIPWHVADVRANAMRNYNMRAERTYWLGSGVRIQVTNGDQSVEDAYASKGVLWQLTNSYAVERGHVTINDLIAISKLQHTTFSQNTHSYALCGSTFMSWLLNLDMGENKRIIKFEDVKDLNIDFKRLKTTFGTTDFTWDQGLDAIGMDEVCVVLDLEGATRYVKIGETEKTNDMSKGAGEIRDAKREIHYEADCLALRGYNSIIVGPSDIIFSMPDSSSRTQIVSAPKLPANPTNGTIVALSEDYSVTVDDVTTTYEAGTVWQYVTNAWVEYTGYTTAV